LPPGRLAVAQDLDLAETAAVTSPASAPLNLLANSQLVSNLTPWVYPSGSFQWVPTDAGGDPRSGAALGIHNGPVNTAVALRQCISVTAGKTYVLTGSAFIPSGGPSTALAAVDIYYGQAADCSDANSSAVFAATFDVGSWRTLAVMAPAPPGTKAARVNFLVGGGTAALAARAYFDRLSFHEGKCAADLQFLCLAGGRFRVNAVWGAPNGTSGNAGTVPFTADSGSFWFFDASNIELNVKVLDGCPANGRYWVFASGGTNVAVSLRVIDTLTGAQKIYSSPQGKLFATVADTSAFSTCP